jgi:lysylphosphatidylglycerol synthetase-like protein (DUF2156 family)
MMPIIHSSNCRPRALAVDVAVVAVSVVLGTVLADLVALMVLIMVHFLILRHLVHSLMVLMVHSLILRHSSVLMVLMVLMAVCTTACTTEDASSLRRWLLRLLRLVPLLELP